MVRLYLAGDVSIFAWKLDNALIWTPIKLTARTQDGCELAGLERAVQVVQDQLDGLAALAHLADGHALVPFRLDGEPQLAPGDHEVGALGSGRLAWLCA